MKTLYVLFKTEAKLTLREFSGVLFGVILPVGIMILLGILYGNAPAFVGATYTKTQQALPAIITVGIMATGLMSIPLSISGYRENKILKRFQVTPTSPMQLLAAQGLNCFIYAVASSLLVWAAAKLFFGYTMLGSFWLFAGFYMLVVVSIYSIGLLVASVSKNQKTTNFLTSIIYFPMFFLSGATLPYEIMPRGLQIVSNIMPLTHGIKLLKTTTLDLPIENAIISIAVLFVTAIVCVIISVKTFKWE